VPENFGAACFSVAIGPVVSMAGYWSEGMLACFLVENSSKYGRLGGIGN
tara:strand:+ start:842 stop:988 length:147 start_codon:yes stop_codon:yes gene_type:complete